MIWRFGFFFLFGFKSIGVFTSNTLATLTFLRPSFFPPLRFSVTARPIASNRSSLGHCFFLYFGLIFERMVSPNYAVSTVGKNSPCDYWLSAFFEAKYICWRTVKSWIRKDCSFSCCWLRLAIGLNTVQFSTVAVLSRKYQLFLSLAKVRFGILYTHGLSGVLGWTTFVTATTISVSLEPFFTALSSLRK